MERAISGGGDHAIAILQPIDRDIAAIRTDRMGASGAPIGAVAQASQPLRPDEGVDTDAVDEFREAVLHHAFRHEPAAAAYALHSAVVAEANQATRDEMVATWFDIMADPATPQYVRHAMQRGAERVVNASLTDAATTRDLAAAIGRLVEDGRIGADELFALVDPRTRDDMTDGARALFSAISDGAVLGQVAERVLDASLGLPTRDYGAREAALVTAADIAVMAAHHGHDRAANATLARIAAEISSGSFSPRAAIETHAVQNEPVPERSAFNALSSLLNATPDTVANLEAKDRLFSAIVQAQPFGRGLQRLTDTHAHDVAGGLEALGSYFNRHVGRLAAADVASHTLVAGVPSDNAHHDLLVSAFVRHVLMHPTALADGGAISAASADAIGRTMAELSAVALDPEAPADARNLANQELALLSGSVARAINQSVADARQRSQGEIAAVRLFTNQVTDAAVKYASTVAGAAGFIVSHAGKQAVDQFWTGVQQRVEAAERDRTLGASEAILIFGQQFRDELGAIRAQPGASTLATDFSLQFHFWLTR